MNCDDQASNIIGPARAPKMATSAIGGRAKYWHQWASSLCADGQQSKYRKVLQLF